MKKIYTLSIFLSLILLFGCSKDFLKSYDNRIIGTWRITDVSRIGLFGDADKLPFKSGTFDFNEDGSLTYVNTANVLYQGRWDIVKKVIDEKTVRSLQVSAINFTNHEILSAYYDDMNFLSTNHFRSETVSTFITYVTHFRR
ncbi:MAG: hypothetical protein ABI151_09850 [Chitinophagaceae bacterium]